MVLAGTVAAKKGTLGQSQQVCENVKQYRKITILKLTVLESKSQLVNSSGQSLRCSTLLRGFSVFFFFLLLNMGTFLKMPGSLMAAFQRPIKELCIDIKSDLRITTNALESLQTAASSGGYLPRC
jgi:hypothetical protein